MSLTPIKAKYNELVLFFQTWIPLYLPNANLYLVGQNAPRPENPYIAFEPIVSIDYMGNDETRMDSEGNETLRGQRYLSCNLYGFSDSETRFDGADNAWEMLQELRFSLRYPDVVELLRGINCRVVEEGVVENDSETLNTTNEPRAVLQIVFSTVIVQSIDSGEIATLNAEGTMTSPTGDDIISDITVTKP